MKIVVTADPCAVPLKKTVIKYLESLGHTVYECGSTETKEVPYYDAAVEGARAIQNGEGEGGIFICGSGMGMSIVGNWFKGVRASVVESVFAAKLCRAINDANVLCLGALLLGEWNALRAIDAFLSTNLGDDMPDIADFLKEAAVKVEAIRS